MNSECKVDESVVGPSLASCGGSTFSVFMLVLEHFLRTQCDIEDPCGQIKPLTNPLPEYDFIVVGGGAAGCVVANRLSEVAEWKVLLVEAGCNEPIGSQVPSFYINAQNTSVDWQYRTEPEATAFLNKGSIIWPRGKVIGGTSVLSSSNYQRGNKRDYDLWNEAGNTGWSFLDVLPYFKKSENNLQIDSVDQGYHGVGGYLPVTKPPFSFPYDQDVIAGAKEMGQTVGDINGGSQIRFEITQATYNNGVKYSASRAFLRPVQDRQNLHIMLNTLVSKVLIDRETKRAFAVEIINEENNEESILARKEVIVCAGAIGSPKILLQSGIGDTKQLSNIGISVVHHLTYVGRNLHDQVGYLVKFTSNQTNERDLNWAVALQYLLFRDGPMTTTENSVNGFIQTKYANLSEDYPDVKLQFWGYQASFSNTGAIFETEDNVEDGNISTRQLSMRSVLVHPKSRGYLTLNSCDHKSPPQIFPGYLLNPADIKPIIEGIYFLISLSKTEALRKYSLKLDRNPVNGCENFSFGSDQYWECAIRRDTNAINQIVGTCKMGPESDLEAVVDPQLRVWGLTGLRVIDSSIMPEIVTGSPLATTIMIAEKGSDMIKEFYGVSSSL